MKPKAQNEHEDGLLEYLEDIIGTSQYKAPIEQASVELEQLNEVRNEKLNRFKLVSKELSDLEVRVLSFTYNNLTLCIR
jgi:structural maintenance of chromosome 4